MALTADERGVVVACSSCGRRNRTPFGASAKCGQCGAALPPPAEPVDVTSTASFDAMLAGVTLPVVVDFWAPWCGPCRMVAPEIARVASAHAGQWLVAKVNTENLPDLAERFGIQSIPTMAVFSGGREIGRALGARPAADIESFVQSQLVDRRA